MVRNPPRVLAPLPISNAPVDDALPIVNEPPFIFMFAPEPVF